MTVHIKLYGTKAERFEEVKQRLVEELGYEPSNPEVVGLMMAGGERGQVADLVRETV